MPESAIIEFKVGYRAGGAAAGRQIRFYQRLLMGLRPVEDWLAADPPNFIFPTWCPRWRPYDHTLDPDQIERIA